MHILNIYRCDTVLDTELHKYKSHSQYLHVTFCRGSLTRPVASCPGIKSLIGIGTLPCFPGNRCVSHPSLYVCAENRNKNCNCVVCKRSSKRCLQQVIPAGGLRTFSCDLCIVLATQYIVIKHLHSSSMKQAWKGVSRLVHTGTWQINN